MKPVQKQYKSGLSTESLMQLLLLNFLYNYMTSGAALGEYTIGNI